MTIKARAMVVCILAVGCLGPAVASAAACTDTWYGPGGSATTATSGTWGTPGNWSNGAVPTTSDAVCITVPGTYTVTVGYYQTTGNVISPVTVSEAGSLTLGAASGTQTLDVSGQSGQNSSDETVNLIALDVSGTATINPTGTLVLDATSAGNGLTPAGGGAMLEGGTFNNSGTIVSQVEDSSYSNSIDVSNLTNEASGNVQINSGALTESQTGSYPWQATNDGSLTIASSASLTQTTGFASTGAFTNDGAVTNNGSITATNNGGTTTWTQTGGSVSGNAVVLENGDVLADSAGSGSFLLNYESGTLTGTIPAGQTVTVEGEPFNSGGETYNSTTALLNGATLVNDGTLVLDAQGSGTSSGGAATIADGTLQNNGQLVAEVRDPSWAVHDQAGLTNAHAGTVTVTGGAFDQDAQNGTAATNDGVVTVGPGVTWLLEEGSSFTNESDGTLSPEIASASSIGGFEMISPCCAGAGTFTAGGTLAPILLGGFTPVANQEFEPFALSGGPFTGSFATVANSFTADYSHESSTPAYVGVIYAPATTKPPPTKPAPAVARVVSISGSGATIIVKLSCKAGGAACRTVSVQGTVTEHLTGGKATAVTARKSTQTKQVVIAAASATLAAGKSKTLTLTLDAPGRALLKKYGKLTTSVTASSGGKTLKTAVVHVQKARKAT